MRRTERGRLACPAYDYPRTRIPPAIMAAIADGQRTELEEGSPPIRTWRKSDRSKRERATSLVPSCRRPARGPSRSPVARPRRFGGSDVKILRAHRDERQCKPGDRGPHPGFSEGPRECSPRDGSMSEMVFVRDRDEGPIRVHTPPPWLLFSPIGCGRPA